MNRVISAELYKLRHCKLLWLIPPFYFAVGFCYASFSHPVFQLYTGLELFVMPRLTALYLSCAIAMLTGYVIGMDFTYKTIRNTLSTGISRKNYYFSRMGVMLLVAALLYLLSLLGYACGRLPVFQRMMGNAPTGTGLQEMELFGMKLAVSTLIGILQMWADAAIMNAACYFIRKQLPAMVVGGVLTLAELSLWQIADEYNLAFASYIFDFFPVLALKNSFEAYAIYDRILTIGYLKFAVSALVIIIFSSAAGYCKFRWYSGND